MGLETEKQKTCDLNLLFELVIYWNKLEISWQKGIVLLFEAEHPSVLIESMLRSTFKCQSN